MYSNMLFKARIKLGFEAPWLGNPKLGVFL